MTETYQGSAPQARHFQPVSWYRSNYILFRIGEILMGWYVHFCIIFNCLVDIFCCSGNSTYAAITAIVAANLVLVAYIITSLRDDQAEREAGKPAESRKDR